MNQVAQENKVEEKKTPEQVSTQPIQVQNNTQEPVAQPEETDKEINWKKFKEAREIERKQAQETAKRAAEKEAEAAALKAALESVLNKQQPQQNYSNNGYEDEETEDQRIEKKVNALLAVRESEAQKRRIQEEQATFPDKLKSIHSDFDQVCSTGNLDYLEYHHPELARSLGSLPQSFEKWNDIYKAIKRYVPNMDTKKDQNRAMNNLNKPQSLSSPGTTQGGNAMPGARLTEERKAENWARMERARKGLS